MTSATEVLLRLLDERGVEWSATVGANGTIWTHWDAFNGQRIHAMDNDDGTVEIFGQWDLTPAQAIAATLGRGTCKVTNECKCSACGWQYPCSNYRTYTTCDGYTAYRPSWRYYNDCGRVNFCPNCGRKVVDNG